jgi:hypothetical protein
MKSTFSKQDILQAYDQLGGINYLYNHPALMERILLKILKQPAPQPSLTINLLVDIPFVNWNNRLSYRESGPELVQETPRITASEPTPWRDAQPDGLAKTMRDFGE